MKEATNNLSEKIKSIISDSPQIVEVVSELSKLGKCKALIEISQEGTITVKIATSVPKWMADFAASHPQNGGFYWVQFEDGKSGMVNIKTDNTFDAVCKKTDEYKNKIFTTFDDAVEALYDSLMEYGTPEYLKKKE